MNQVLNVARTYIGYLEKKDCNPAYLYNNTANAGYNNYTMFWDMLCKSLQGQPWCNAFVNAVFVQAHGTTLAKKLLCTDGDWSYYTPTSASYFKKKGQWHTTPKVGDIIYFKNSERIHHVGLVVGVTNDTVETIEGNTSSSTEVVANGGGVFKKSYKISNPSIAGYGRPNYDLVDGDKYTVGWQKDNTGWWYAYTTKAYYKSCWQIINKCKYYFNDKGYAVTGMQTIDGKRYFFEDTPGASKECALMKTTENGDFILWRED